LVISYDSYEFQRDPTFKENDWKSNHIGPFGSYLPIGQDVRNLLGMKYSTNPEYSRSAQCGTLHAYDGTEVIVEKKVFNSHCNKFDDRFGSSMQSHDMAVATGCTIKVWTEYNIPF